MLPAWQLMPPQPPVRVESMPPTRSTFPKSRSALLVIDAINPLDFPGGKAFARRAARTARSIARLAERARKAAVPVVFVNDNFGRWRSDMKALVKFVSQPGSAGQPLVEALRPTETDFVVLKSTLSGFYQTPLEAMLRQGQVTSVIITGFLTGNCVLFTAVDAYMRDFKIIIPSDTALDLTREKHRDALAQMADVLKGKVAASRRLSLRR
jgi:nicotinamidase-related amidase